MFATILALSSVDACGCTKWTKKAIRTLSSLQPKIGELSYRMLLLFIPDIFFDPEVGPAFVLVSRAGFGRVFGDERF